MPKCSGIESEWPGVQWRKARSLALFFKKFGGEWNYKQVCFIFLVCFVLEGECIAFANHFREKGGPGT